MPYGRQLRGLGLVPDTQEYGDTWSGNDEAVRRAAQADDVAGNGIFDGPGAPPTAHANTGVFSSSFSLPGYVYREQPTEPSEIRDTTTGNQIIYQPGPANWYADMREAYRPFDLETPRYYSGNPALPVPALQGLGDAAASATFMDTIKAYAPYAVIGAVVGLGVMYLSHKGIITLPSFLGGGRSWNYDEA